MTVGILRHTLQFVDGLTPEHAEALADWLTVGEGLWVERDEARQLVTYHLDHPDFAASEGCEYGLAFARDILTQDIYVSTLMCRDAKGNFAIARRYTLEDQRLRSGGGPSASAAAS